MTLEHSITIICCLILIYIISIIFSVLLYKYIIRLENKNDIECAIMISMVPFVNTCVLIMMSLFIIFKTFFIRIYKIHKQLVNYIYKNKI